MGASISLSMPPLQVNRYRAILACFALCAGVADAQQVDARMRTISYAQDAVVRVPVVRGMVTHIVLNDDETVSLPPATGKGADCSRETDTWCIAAVGRDIFIKPKVGATRNNMVVVTNQRRHAFELIVQPEGSTTNVVMRLAVRVPRPAPPPPAVVAAAPALPPAPPPLTPQQLIENRMKAEPAVRNTSYSVATAENSEDIVPTMVFDNGTHTFFQFPNNRPLPTIFQTASDQSEEMVNVRVQDDMLVADRVGKRFVLRLGESVASIINEAFDLDGVPPRAGTTVPGVQRVRRPEAAASALSAPSPMVGSTATTASAANASASQGGSR